MNMEMSPQGKPEEKKLNVPIQGGGVAHNPHPHMQEHGVYQKNDSGLETHEPAMPPRGANVSVRQGGIDYTQGDQVK